MDFLKKMFTTFFHTDELILVYVEYQIDGNQWNNKNRNEIQFLGVDYDGDGIISVLDHCKNSEIVTSEEFYINSKGCLEEKTNGEISEINVCAIKIGHGGEGGQNFYFYFLGPPPAHPRHPVVANH